MSEYRYLDFILVNRILWDHKFLPDVIGCRKTQVLDCTSSTVILNLTLHWIYKMYNEPLLNNFVSHNHAVYYWQMTENSILKNDLYNYLFYTVIKKSCSIQNKGITWELTNSKILITVNLYLIIDIFKWKTKYTTTQNSSNI